MDNEKYLEKQISERFNNFFNESDLIREIFTSSVKKLITKNIKSLFRTESIHNIVNEKVDGIFKNVFNDNFERIIDHEVSMQIQEAVKISFESQDSFGHQLSILINNALRKEILNKVK